MRTELATIYGILLPLLGTSLGAGCVFLTGKTFGRSIQKIMNGFAAGVMAAAAVWSLLLPAIEQAAERGIMAWPLLISGFWAGVGLLLILEILYPQRQLSDHQTGRTKGKQKSENTKNKDRKATMLVFAVTVHNIPEGMAVGAAFAGWLSQGVSMTAAGVLALSVGIAIQNFPEGAIISLPLRAGGMRKRRAFWCGVLSGVVEPVAAVGTLFAAGLILPALPGMLSFAAGAMLYVVVAELLPELIQSERSTAGPMQPGILSFFVGFTVMMLLDSVLG